jgi:hypothetical protein
MTQAEMESTIQDLKERLAEMEIHQQRRRASRLRLGTISICVAIGFLIWGSAIALVDLWFHMPKPSPEILPALFMVAPLAILARGLWAEAE